MAYILCCYGYAHSHQCAKIKNGTLMYKTLEQTDTRDSTVKLVTWSNKNMRNHKQYQQIKIQDGTEQVALESGWYDHE